MLQTGAVTGTDPASVNVRRIEPADLVSASELWLTNSTGRVVPVREVQSVGRFQCPGPVTRALTRAVREREADDRRSSAAKT